MAAVVAPATPHAGEEIPVRPYEQLEDEGPAVGDSVPHAHFTNKWTLLLSVLGCAIGTGNIWRFPRIAAQEAGNDGVLCFLIVWLCFLFLWSIPLIIVEYSMGKKVKKGVIEAFAIFGGEKRRWMGAFIGLVTTFISFYYSVISGWSVFYFFRFLFYKLPETELDSLDLFNDFTSSGLPVLFYLVTLSVCLLACWKGVSTIEKANLVLVPVLLLVLVVSFGRAVSLEHASEGIKFLFSPTWSMLGEPKMWLEALTQNAWDTGAGWGVFLCYSIYMKESHGVVKYGTITPMCNNCVSILAGTTIFATTFAMLADPNDTSCEEGTKHCTRGEILDIMQHSGPASTGLTYVWIPVLYSKMSGGRVLVVFFFLGLMSAAVSSLISTVELPVRLLVDAGVSRRRAIAMYGLVAVIFGLPSALSVDFLANQDFVWGTALVGSGLMYIMVTLIYGVPAFRSSVINIGTNDWVLGRWWERVIKYVSPVEAVTLLVWYLVLSIADSGQWFNPAQTDSFMSCMLQWLLIAFPGAFLFAHMARGRKGVVNPDDKKAARRVRTESDPVSPMYSAPSTSGSAAGTQDMAIAPSTPTTEEGPRPSRESDDAPAPSPIV